MLQDEVGGLQVQIGERLVEAEPRRGTYVMNLGEMLQAAIDHSQAKVEGTVRMKLYKGGVHITGRKSPHSLYSEKVVTFEDDQGAYDQRDAAGFIKLNALRLRLLGRRDR